MAFPWCTGTGGLKGSPAADGVGEIACGVTPDYQGKGYATQAAQALTAYDAFSSGKVRVVRTHTRPEPNASTWVLAKGRFPTHWQGDRPGKTGWCGDSLPKNVPKVMPTSFIAGDRLAG
jgi:GNAT acetyltransferase-like protein